MHSSRQKPTFILNFLFWKVTLATMTVTSLHFGRTSGRKLSSYMLLWENFLSLCANTSSKASVSGSAPHTSYVRIAQTQNHRFAHAAVCTLWVSASVLPRDQIRRNYAAITRNLIRELQHVCVRVACQKNPSTTTPLHLCYNQWTMRQSIHTNLMTRCCAKKAVPRFYKRCAERRFSLCSTTSLIEYKNEGGSMPQVVPAPAESYLYPLLQIEPCWQSFLAYPSELLGRGAGHLSDCQTSHHFLRWIRLNPCFQGGVEESVHLLAWHKSIHALSCGELALLCLWFIWPPTWEFMGKYCGWSSNRMANSESSTIGA